MLVAAVTLLAASAIHFGLSLPLGPVTLHDPFAGAAIPEAVLGVVLMVGAGFVLSGWSGRWTAALATALFTLLVTLYGLSITVSGGRTGDVAYHLVLLSMLVILVGLLLSPAGKRALRA
jgi:hypothetical protein